MNEIIPRSPIMITKHKGSKKNKRKSVVCLFMLLTDAKRSFTFYGETVGLP